MAFKLITREWCAPADDFRLEFVCDNESDILDLPECGAGSIAIVAESGSSAYMVNASGVWSKL